MNPEENHRGKNMQSPHRQQLKSDSNAMPGAGENRVNCYTMDEYQSQL